MVGADHVECMHRLHATSFHAAGAAMGTGSAIAHRAVDSMMGPRETTVVHQQAPAAAAPSVRVTHHAPVPAADPSHICAFYEPCVN